MPISTLARRFSPELRASVYYFINFTSAGAAVAYAGIWFAGEGLSSGEIGVINAVPVFIMLGLNLLVGRIADRAKDWRQVIIAGALASAFLPLGLFFAHGFGAILRVWTAIAVPVAAIGPVADAASLRLTKRNGTDFGAIRAWGTVGFMAFNALTGLLVGWFGAAVFLPLYALLNFFRGVASLWLPRFRAPAEARTVAAALPAAGKLREVMRPWFLLPLIGSSLVFGTHIILNAFAALLWQRQGIPEEVIGPLIALAAFAEAATMFAYRRFVGQVPARQLILISAAASVVRWSAMAFSPPVYVLVLLQLLQSLTFALGYLGTVHFITKWTSEDIAAEVQSFFVVLQQAISVVALLGFGWLIGVMGAKGYLVAALLALAGGGCVWLSIKMRQPLAPTGQGAPTAPVADAAD